MELLNPLALGLIPLVAVLLWLNSRRPRERQSVANLYLWQQAAVQAPARLRFPRVWRHRLLALQIAFMLAAIVALARPSVSSSDTNVAFVFDLSASMGARAENGTRLDLAKARASTALGGLSGRQVRIISAQSTPIDRGRFRVSDDRVKDAIASQATTAGPSAIADAIRLARLADGPDARVIVFSDRSEPRPTLGGVQWIQVGQAGENVAVTALAARRNPIRRSEDEVLIGLHNFGTRPREVAVGLKRDDAVVATERVTLEAGAARTILEHVPAGGGVLVASIPDDDDLAVDNRRLTVVPSTAPLRVLLRTVGNPYLEQALASNPDVALETIAPAASPRGGDYDVVVCDECAEIPAGREGVLLFRAAGAASTDAAPLVVSQSGHEIARALDLNDVFAALPAGATAAAQTDVVIRAGAQPAVVAYEREGRRGVEVRIALRASNLPLSIGFPILVANATDWVAARNRQASVVTAGEPLRWNVPSGTRAADVRIVSPDGREPPATIEGTNLTFAETGRTGVYTVRGLGAERRFVVNAATTESNLAITAFESSPSLPGAGDAQRRSRDAAIWFIVLAIGILTVEWWAFQRHAPAGRAFAARGVTLALLALAAAGVSVPTAGGQMDVVFVLDRSDSISARAQSAALASVGRMAAAMRSDDRAGLVVFGADAAIERQPTSGFRAGDVSSTVGMSGTNIEAALDLARSALPDRSRGRIVLLSDGQETDGASANAAARAAAERVHVDTMTVESPASSRPRVTHVAAPSDVQVGEPFAIRVDVEGRANVSERVVLFRDGERVAERDAAISSAGTSLAFSDTRSADGAYTYTAALASADDDDVRAAGSVVMVSGVPTMLYIGSPDGVSAPLAASGFRVERTTAPAIPSDVASLRRFSAVVLDHVVPERVTAAQAAALGAYVEQTGGGLLVLGDAQTLDAGGFAAGPLGRLLPVDFRPRAGRRDSAIGLVVVFDKSGSMADRADGIPKIEIAREAAKKAFDVVPPSDSVGVVAFDAAPTVAVPFGPARDARAVVEQLRAIQPGGSTAIAPAVGMAVDWLRGANVTKRYVLLVSDGRTSPADADRLRSTIRGAGVELSVVAIGTDADRPFLLGLAESTGGRAYFPDDARLLPAIVAREATRAAGGSIVTEPFAVRAGMHPVLNGIDRSALPTMGGYVVGAVKPGASAILSSHLDDPILAGWQAGLGRVVVFTSDLASPWTAAFHRWPAYAPLWAQTARWLGRRSSDRLLAAEVVESAGSATLVVDAERPDGQAANLTHVRVGVRTPDGGDRVVDLTPQRPGRYEATIPATQTGAYLLSVTARDESGGDARVVRGFYWSADRERRARGVDAAKLAQIAAITGGRVLGPDDNPFDGERPRGAYPLRPVLLMAALIVFLVDVATRRGLRRTFGGRPGTAPPHEAAA